MKERSVLRKIFGSISSSKWIDSLLPLAANIREILEKSGLLWSIPHNWKINNDPHQNSFKGSIKHNGPHLELDNALNRWTGYKRIDALYLLLDYRVCIVKIQSSASPKTETNPLTFPLTM